MERGNAATRLRQARLDAGLALNEIERRTRISPTMLRWIDEGHFHRLPAGIYARAYVRAFAEAVGLDPAEVVSSLEHALPRVDEAATTRSQTPGSGVRPREQGDRRGEAERGGSRVPRPRRVDRRWLWMAAASIDAVILVTVCAIVVAAAAAVCGAPPGEIVALGLPGLLGLLGVFTSLYFGIFAGVQGRTPGARACGLPPLETASPVHLDLVARRALRAFLIEASLGVELASRRSPPRQLQTTSPYGSRSTP
jgi:transcriptional regulator with XRE-family HTH domain